MAGFPSVPSHMPMASPGEMNSMLNPAVGNTQPVQGPEVPPEINQWLDQQRQEDKYGGVGGGLSSLALGAADSATLGLSNVALTKTGIMDEKTLKALQDVNPGLYKTGEVAGVFAPGGAASLIGKAGKATIGGLKAIKAIQGIGEATMAARVLGGAADVAAHAAGSAVEGAAYAGIGNTLNEYALGDPDLNGEKIMGHFGSGALMGGLFGAALKTAAIGAPEAIAAGKKALGNIYNIAAGEGHGEESLISKGLDVVNPEGKLSDAFANRAKNLDVDQMGDLVQKTSGGLNTIKKNLDTATKNLNSEVRPIETKALINTANKEKVLVSTQNVINDINRTKDEIVNNPGIYDTNALAKLEKWRLQVVNNLEDDSPLSRFDLLKEVKQGVGNWGAGITPGVTHADTKNLLGGLSGRIGSMLKDPEVFGAAGAAYQAHDEMLKKIYEFTPPVGSRLGKTAKEFKNAFLDSAGSFSPNKIKKFLKTSDLPESQRARDLLDQWFDVQKQLPEHLENTYANVPNDLWDKHKLSGLMDSLEKTHGDIGLAQTQYSEALKNQKGAKMGLRDLMIGGVAAAHPLLGGLAFAGDVASRPIEYINKLAEAERILGKASDGMNRAAKSIFTPTVKMLDKVKGPLIRQITTPDAQGHMKLRDKLSELNQNPSLMVDRLNAATGDLHSVAPNMAEGLQGAMIRANQFLASKMPYNAQVNPFEEEHEPSKSEIANFENYHQIVENPHNAFEQVKDGTIGPETIETLSVVYPKVYQEMKQAVLKEVTNKVASKTPIPYRLKQSISYFLGTPIDAGLTPQATMANQQSFMRSMQQHQAQSMGQQKNGDSKLTLAKRSGLNRGVMEA